MDHKYYPDFTCGHAKLFQMGGQFQRAAEELHQLMGRIVSGEEDPFKGMKVTKNGETRLKHCVKYDLQGYSRLITVKNKGICFLLFTGSHDDSDKWLNKNKGKEFKIDKNGTLIQVSRPSQVIDLTQEPLSSDRQFVGEQKLLDRIKPKYIKPLLELLHPMVALGLPSLTALSTDDDLIAACDAIEDNDLQCALIDVLIALLENNVENARNIVGVYMGDISDISDDQPINGTRELQTIPTDSPEWLQIYKHYVETAELKEWMLFLHPDQSHIVKRDFNGPAKLLGVSGSGKTCIVVKRALRLAEMHPDDNLLILTLNKPLASLIGDLVASAAPDNLSQKVQAQAFFEVCQDLLHEFEPDNDKLYSNVAWKSKEHIDAIWHEFYRCDLNNNDAAILHALHDSLIAQGVDAESYIREEFDWIRSAIPHQDRDAYYELDRKGRSIGLQKTQKELLLKGLSGWERKMRAVGVIDGLGLVAALQPHLDKIKPKFRSILVDESQDFGTSELEIVRRLVEKGENDIFICGDAAQKVSTKYQKLQQAGINIPGARSLRINKNYRNSKEILLAANKVLITHINEALTDNDEFEILAPEYADFNGSTPLLLSADNLENEISYSLKYVTEEVSANQNWKGCIAIAGYSLYEIEQFGKMLGIPVLDGKRSISEDDIYLSDLAQTKGFEFNIMVVLNLSEGVLPNPHIPTLEQAKDLAQLYVSMTRARNQLILSHHSNLSPLLKNMDDVFREADWSLYVNQKPKLKGIPPRLSELSNDSDIPQNIAMMDGGQFLYQQQSIGLSVRLIEAIRAKVGKSDPSTGKMTVGTDIGYTHQLTIDDFKSRNKFGREASKDLQELGMKIGIGRLHKERLKEA